MNKKMNKTTKTTKTIVMILIMFLKTQLFKVKMRKKKKENSLKLPQNYNNFQHTILWKKYQKVQSKLTIELFLKASKLI